MASAVFLAVAAAHGAAGPGDTIRVLATEAACFEYTFTSVVSESGGRTVVSLNDLYGRTHFVAVGGSVGDYDVCRLEQETQRVFNASINAFQTRRLSKLILKGPGGESVALGRGETRPEQGLMACLVSLTTAEWQYVRAGDTITLAEAIIPVKSVSETEVRGSAAGYETTIPMISEPEKDALRATWEQKQKKIEEKSEAVALAVIRAEQAEEASGRRVRYVAPRVSHVNFSVSYPAPTDPRYQPTAYWILPAGVVPPGGTKPSPTPMVIPIPLPAPPAFHTFSYSR